MDALAVVSIVALKMARLRATHLRLESLSRTNLLEESLLEESLLEESLLEESLGSPWSSSTELGQSRSSAANHACRHARSFGFSLMFSMRWRTDMRAASYIVISSPQISSLEAMVVHA